MGFAALELNSCTIFLTCSIRGVQGRCAVMNVSWRAALRVLPGCLSKNLLGHRLKQEGSRSWLSVIIHCQNQYRWQALVHGYLRSKSTFSKNILLVPLSRPNFNSSNYISRRCGSPLIPSHPILLHSTAAPHRTQLFL